VLVAFFGNLLLPIGLLHPGISIAGIIGSALYLFLKLSLGGVLVAFISSLVQARLKVAPYLPLALCVGALGVVVAAHNEGTPLSLVMSLSVGAALLVSL